MEQEASGLTKAEQEVMDNLVNAWNAFVELRGVSDDDVDDFRRAIHEGQRILASRVVARLYPEYWR